MKTGFLLVLGALAGSSAAASAPAPCSSRPESAQFDFWLGEWDVEETGVPGKTIASSREEKIVAGCVLLENYEEPGGDAGKSVNFFDPVLSKWRQIWVDGAGNSSEFAGGIRDGAMRFEGESHTASGKRVYRRLTFTPLSRDSVRQLSEASPDGKTWKVNYDYTYRRKGVPSAGGADRQE